MLHSNRTALYALTITLFVAATAALLTIRYRFLVNAVEHDLTERLAMYEDNTSLLMQNLESIMRATQDEVLQGASPEELDAYLKTVGQTLPQLRTLLVFDSEGVVLGDSRAGSPAVGLYAGDRTYFQVYVESDRTALFIDDPVESRIDGNWSMPVTLPVRTDDGTLIGVIAASIDPLYFSRLNSSQIVEQAPLRGYLINERYRILTNIPYQPDLVNLDLSAYEPFQFSPDEIIVHRLSDFIDGRAHFVAITRVEPYELFVMFDQPTNAIQTIFLREAVLIGGVMLVLCASVIMVANRQAAQEQLIGQQSESLHRTRQQLTRREREFALLMETTQDVVTQFDRDLRHLYINPAIEQYTGIPAEEYIGKTNAELGFDSEQATLWDGTLRKVFEEGKPHTIAFQLDGLNHFYARFTPQFDAEGAVETVFGMVRDITPIKQAEQMRLEAERMSLKIEQERTLIELKEHFLATASHNFRAPLTVIKNAAFMLRGHRDRLSAEKRTDMLEQITRQVNRMMRLLDGVLTLSKAGTNHLTYEAEMVDLKAFCDELWQSVLTLDEERHHLEYDYQAETTLIKIDENLLYQTLMNVLSNAIKYTPEGKSVRFKVTTMPDALTFTIQDEGIGIPEAERATLFQPFSRASNATDRPGTGLGLAIVQTFVDIQKGNVDLESIVGEGTTVSVTIPTNGHSSPDRGNHTSLSQPPAG